MKIRPTTIQKQALKALVRTRKGRNKAGLVVMATGLGKTYLSSMFAKKFKRVLFVAHKDEMLTQAEDAFEKVSPERVHSRFDGKHKDLSGQVVFAMVQTLRNHLRKVKPSDFDLVVVDEFHHSAAASYRKLLKKLKPKFLLGLTATPERTDRQDIFRFCGYNEVFNCSLKESFRRKALAPVRYHGVDDTVDFKPIPWRGSRFDPAIVARAAATKKRAAESLKQWRRLAGERTLAFCCTVTHAQFMHKYFKDKGVASAVVHGKTPHDDRRQALEDLSAGDIEVLFSVDVFNEGVDVPNIDTVLMLRSTESKLIWLQQIGRGLRKAKGKTHLTVIDFIGNHPKFREHLKDVVFYLTGERVSTPRKIQDKEYKLPPGCDIFIGDLQVVKHWLKEPNRITQKAEAVRLWEGGLRDCMEISRRLSANGAKVSGWGVRFWLVSTGIDTRRGPTKEVLNETQRLWDEGLRNCQKIAARMTANGTKVSSVTVGIYLKSRGIDTCLPGTASEATIDKAQRLWDKGLRNCAEISRNLTAKGTKVSQSAILRGLKSRGINTQLGASEGTIDEAVKLWERILNGRQIAEQLGVSAGTVLKWLKKRGVDTRRRRPKRVA